MEKHMEESHYTISKWEASCISLNFLDLTLIINNGAKKLAYCPHIKPSALSVPLTQISAQANSVHIAWPKTELRRLARNSSHPTYFWKARAEFMYKLAISGYRTDWLEQLEKYNAWTKPVRRQTNDNAENTIWCVLPGHPVCRILAPALETFMQAEGSRANIGSGALEHFMSNLKFRFSYKNPGKHLKDVLTANS